MQKNIAPIYFAEIKRQISVASALRLYGWRHTTSEPAGLRGPCPLHGSRSPHSRSLSVADQEWYCHVCRRGGDVLLLWAELHHTTIVQAALDLCERFGISVPRRI